MLFCVHILFLNLFPSEMGLTFLKKKKLIFSIFKIFDWQRSLSSPLPGLGLAWSCGGFVRVIMATVRSWLQKPYHIQKSTFHCTPFHLPFLNVSWAFAGVGSLIQMSCLGLNIQLPILSTLNSYISPYWLLPTVKRNFSDQDWEQLGIMDINKYLEGNLT